MNIGKLVTIGDGVGIVVPRYMLRELGWFKGDQVLKEVHDGQLVIQNFHRSTVRPIHTRKELGDGPKK